jgi:heme-degrading monooxygenase HmoA
MDFCRRTFASTVTIEGAGLVAFHLLKGPEAEDHRLYASHTIWESRAVFEAWTKSEAFRAAHSRAGTTSRCIWITRSLRGSRFARRWGAKRRDAYASGCQLLNASLMSVIGGEPDLTRTYHFVAD